MTDFSINFTYPWLLLLLIPALALVFWPYFRLEKKFRKSCTRVVSLTLRCIVVTAVVFLLAGTSFSYSVPNPDNEIILLVDASDSEGGTVEQKNEFVRSAIENCDDSYKVGIVTFGYNQVYAVELGSDLDTMYQNYLQADTPDGGGTDISAALRYAGSLFTHPDSAKIILLSDGLETDDSAAEVIQSVVADGLAVDTVCFSADRTVSEVQIEGVTTPDYNVAIGEVFTLGLSVRSSVSGEARITLTDNGVADEPVTISLTEGEQTILLEHSYMLPGLHSLGFSISCGNDTLSENNMWYSYMYVESYDDILIIERTSGESSYLTDILDEPYNVTVVNVFDEQAMPSSVDELRQYDEVILVNIANADMPDGFVEMLNSYVYDYGGGMFTVGGNRIDPETQQTVANAYNRSDMIGTFYQEMLPVEAIDYTPPLGVILVIDRSGSMSTVNEATQKTYLDLAKEAAKAALLSLSERDYCGIMSLNDSYSEEIEVTPVTEMSRIFTAIDAIEIGGGTFFTGALQAAGSALSRLNVEKRHIIIISDGEAHDSPDQYNQIIDRNMENDITLSIVGITPSNATAQALSEAATRGGGYFYSLKDDQMTQLTQTLRHDLTVDEITEVVYETFTPQIGDHTSVVNGVLQSDMPTLDGFYGTRVKTGANITVDTPLVASYVPIYAQWQYGEGRVGSFMCDLNGTWSLDFVTNDTGRLIVSNIVGALLPTQNIRPQEMEVAFSQDNFTTQMSVLTELSDSDVIEATLTPMAGEEGDEVDISPSAETGYSRSQFTIRQAGVYMIHVVKKNGAGEVLAELTAYRTFSYSEEYNAFADAGTGEELLEMLAGEGDGNVIEQPSEILEGLEKTLGRGYDPRLVLLIVSIVLFLADIAVRKFRLKWPRELIRDIKEKRAGHGV